MKITDRNTHPKAQYNSKTIFIFNGKQRKAFGVCPRTKGIRVLRKKGRAMSATLSWIYPLYIKSLLLGLVVVLLGLFLRLDEILAGLAHRIGGVGRNQVRPLAGVGIEVLDGLFESRILCCVGSYRRKRRRYLDSVGTGPSKARGNIQLIYYSQSLFNLSCFSEGCDPRFSKRRILGDAHTFR